MTTQPCASAQTILKDAVATRGTAFTHEERGRFGLSSAKGLQGRPADTPAADLREAPTRRSLNGFNRTREQCPTA